MSLMASFVLRIISPALCPVLLLVLSAIGGGGCVAALVVPTFTCTNSGNLCMRQRPLQTAVHKSYSQSKSLVVPTTVVSGLTRMDAAAADDNNDNDEADRLRKRAQELRQEIQGMEDRLDKRGRRRRPPPPTLTLENTKSVTSSSPLNGKRILVVGANGRLGSMVCRHLLRSTAVGSVVAAVHVVGEQSTRGYGRLSYEVGAEDGVGTIGAAWSSQDERTATFVYNDDVMKDYNLQKLRVVEVELLDPIQCATITEGVDSIIYCATDFNGNTPRAVSGLNLAFLFRAVADPLKGRVEIEGLRNILGGLKRSKQEKKASTSAALDAVLGKTRMSSTTTFSNDDDDAPVDVVLVSAAPNAFGDFETPFGTFNGLKREGEELLKNEFPSLSYTILQMSKYEDNFVDENLDILSEEQDGGRRANNNSDDEQEQSEQQDDEFKRRINRRDAARAAVDALTENGKGKTLQVWTALR